MIVRDAVRRVDELLVECKAHNARIRVIYFGQEVWFDKNDTLDLIEYRLRKADRQDVDAEIDTEISLT